MLRALPVPILLLAALMACEGRSERPATADAGTPADSAAPERVAPQPSAAARPAPSSSRPAPGGAELVSASALASAKLPPVTAKPCKYGEHAEDIFENHPDIVAAAQRDIGAAPIDYIVNDDFQDCLRAEDGRELLVVYGKAEQARRYAPAAFVYDFAAQRFAWAEGELLDADPKRGMKYLVYGKPDALTRAILLKALATAKLDAVRLVPLALNR